MKIRFIDYATESIFIVRHDPVEIAIKPREQIAKIVDGKQIVQFKYYCHTLGEDYLKIPDLMETIIDIYVDKSSKKILERKKL